MIEDIKKEFIEHGQFANTLNLINVCFRVKDAMKRHQCDLDTLIKGMQLAVISQIETNDFRCLPGKIIG